MKKEECEDSEKRGKKKQTHSSQGLIGFLSGGKKTLLYKSSL